MPGPYNQGQMPFAQQQPLQNAQGVVPQFIQDHQAQDGNDPMPPSRAADG